MPWWPHAGGERRHNQAMAPAAALLLIVVVFPLWIAAGLADWACHRATRIESTSGLTENLLHWVLLAQAGVAVLAMALLHINAAVLLIVLAAFMLHELTVWLELRYTVPRREVRPIEQMVHSFEELLPRRRRGAALQRAAAGAGNRGLPEGAQATLSTLTRRTRPSPGPR